MGGQDDTPNDKGRGLAVLDVDLGLDNIMPDSWDAATNVGQAFGGMAQTLSLSLVNDSFLKSINQMAETQARLIASINLTPMLENVQKVLQSIRTPIFSATLVQGFELIRNIALPRAWEAAEAFERPTMVSVLEAPTSFNFGFTILIDGRFEYKGRQLQNLYHTSKQGKLLIMLLEFPEHYVSNEAIKAKLGNFDPVKGIPNLMAELKRRLQMDGLEVKVTRRWSEGYQLKSVRSR